MNEKLKSTILVATALCGLMAVIGRDALPLLMALPKLASAWSAGLPFGLWSVAFALMVSICAWGFSVHWLPDLADGSRPQFAAAVIAILVAVGVTMTQVMGQPIPVKINAAWMGLTAGITAPTVANLIRSLFVKAAAPTP